MSSLTAERGQYAFCAGVTLLGLAVIEAGCVLVWIARAIVQRKYERTGPEASLRTRLAELEAYYDRPGLAGEARDKKLPEDVRRTLLHSCIWTTPIKRVANKQRYKYRAWASPHLVKRLIWAKLESDRIKLTTLDREPAIA